jgi:hypothetical protein
MSSENPGSEKDSQMNAANWTKIATGVLGAVLLGLQGINLTEVTHGNQNGEKRMQVLEQLLVIGRDTKELLDRQTKMLDNQTQTLQNGVQLLKNDDDAFHRQQQILETLKAAIAERKELLEKNLRDAQKQPPNQ